MTIYNYDRETKAFISENEATESPLEPGVFLIPADATTIPPLEIIDNKVPCFVAGVWTQNDDLRGQTVYEIETKMESVIDYVGPIADGFTELEPTEFDVWNVDKWEVDADAELQSVIKTMNSGIQAHLNTQAQLLRYDDINSIGKYVGYDNEFRVESEKLGAWAGSCWKVAEQIETDVINEVREIPTLEEVILELPTY